MCACTNTQKHTINKTPPTSSAMLLASLSRLEPTSEIFFAAPMTSMVFFRGPRPLRIWIRKTHVNKEHPPWLGHWHNALTPARTPWLHVVKCCTVMWVLCSAMINSLHNSIHPPETERNLLKTACGCPCGRVKKKEKKVMQSFLLMDCTCHCTAACSRWYTQSSAGEHYSNNSK